MARNGRKIARRRDTNTIRVFVYGSLLRGFHNHAGRLDGAGSDFVGPNATADCSFRMYDFGAFPAICRVDRDGESITGECYRVNAATLARLDALEGHPNFYAREPLAMIDGSVAWAYLIPRETLSARRLPRVLGGSWAAYKSGEVPEPVVEPEPEPERDPFYVDADPDPYRGAPEPVDECVGSGDCESCAACVTGARHFATHDVEPTILYFAFGSNLDPEQMRRRCPSSRLVARGSLPNNRITFAGNSKSWGGAVATVVPERGAHCDGIVYACTPSDLRRLDACEGYPIVYDRRRATIKLANGSTCKAWIYFLPLSRKRTERGTPSVRYLSQIWRAYKREGFDVDPLFDAAIDGVDWRAA